MDFTPKTYRQLLLAFQQAGYTFLRYEDYCGIKQNGEALPDRFVILRHDVDKKPKNSLAFAQIENEMGIATSYYFRIVAQSNSPAIIKKIVDLGHEIGYHYEDLSACKGDGNEAKTHFKAGLDYFRSFYPVKTICMHGSPMSKIDNRDIWKFISYKNYEIIGEPYFDIDYDKVFYITDTGRRWDGDKYSVRDKVTTSFTNSYHSTDYIISALEDFTFPAKCMMTTHPQRWTDDTKDWIIELFAQNIKNLLKHFLVNH